MTRTALSLWLLISLANAGSSEGRASSPGWGSPARPEPGTERRVGFEILEIQSPTSIRAWISTDITREEFDALELPPRWRKNQPREGGHHVKGPDSGRFLRSPDADGDGEFLDQELFGFTWRHSATVVQTGTPLDEGGLLMAATVKKFHELTFDAGSTLVLLVSPEDEVYFRIGRDADRSSDEPTIPRQWRLVEYTAPEELVFQLFDRNLVIRTDNQDSFQGPIEIAGFSSENGLHVAETESGSGSSACLTPASASFVRPFSVDAEEYPFRSCAFETSVGLIHYFDEGPRDSDETIVFVHGNPTWSFLYRNIAKAMIADGHRVVALDHIGMGMSDVPSTSDFDYRPRSHADHLEQLVLALDLNNVTLVLQDWGGPIGLGMATQQPERVSRMLIMNTWAWSIDADEPGLFHALASWSSQVKRLKRANPTFFCDMALPGQSTLNAREADPTRGVLFQAVRSAYVSPAIDTATGSFRHAEPCAPMQIFAESISDDDAYQGEVEERISRLRGKPYSLLFGLSDILFGALRCDLGRSPSCPGMSSCTCDAELLPARVPAVCRDGVRQFNVCKESDGSVIEPYADRFVELLGTEALVRRDVEPDSDHMIQEWAPERVIQALRELLAAD